ncbi:unnamed protein product [Ectocarpus sp. CCAP 1310/34]|nr:unnamed protein product [Ectocarpus sp. CCAP 1310/34]
MEELEACPSPVQEALPWMATSAVGVLDIASVGPLEPVCQAFKALIEAAEGAVESQEKLQSLVSRCRFLTTVLIRHRRAVDPLAQVQTPIGDFVVTTNKLAAFAESGPGVASAGRFFCHRTDLSTLTDFEEGLRRIGADINSEDGLEYHQQSIGLGRALLPPSLPDMAAVPAGALALPHSYVERAAVQEVADGLTNPEEPRAPYSAVGMGGGGKSVLASAVVRKSSVTQHFRGGRWALGHPRASPRLVVLDDVWEPEVVDALLPLGLKVLVTTIDRSVLGVSSGCVEVGDMTEGEALELLRKTSRTVGRCALWTSTVGARDRGFHARRERKGLTAGAWGKLIELEDVATKMEASDEDSDSLNVVLETSFNALTLTKKREFKKSAVLAPGAVVSTEMLLNLWETKDTGGTREEAEGLVSKCLPARCGWWWVPCS